VYENYAQTLYFDKQYNKSLQEIEKVLAQKQDNATLHRLEAYNHYELQNYAQGLQKMESFLASIPKEKRIYLDYLTLGRFYTKQKEYDKAIENLNTAISLDSKNPDGYKEIAAAYSSAEKYDESLKNFETYFELNPNYFNIDLYQYSEVCIDASRAICSEISSTQPKEVIAAQKTLLEMYVEKGAKANTDLIQRAPESHLGYYERANTYAFLDTYAQKTGQNIEGVAKPYYEEALEFMLKNNEKGDLNSKIVGCYNYLRSYHYVKKDTKSMIEVVKKILAIDPTNERAKADAKALKIKI